VCVCVYKVLHMHQYLDMNVTLEKFSGAKAPDTILGRKPQPITPATITCLTSALVHKPTDHPDWQTFTHHAVTHTCTHTHTQHNHFTALWTLSWRTRVSQYQKVHFAIFWISWSKMKITQACCECTDNPSIRRRQCIVRVTEWNTLLTTRLWSMQRYTCACVSSRMLQPNNIKQQNHTTVHRPQSVSQWLSGAKSIKTVSCCFVYNSCVHTHVSVLVLWRCWLGGRKGIRSVKNWVVGCWRGYLSGVRCRFAYGPADATATHCLLLKGIQISFGFTFLVPAHPGSPGQNPDSCKTVVEVVVLVKKTGSEERCQNVLSAGTYRAAQPSCSTTYWMHRQCKLPAHYHLPSHWLALYNEWQQGTWTKTTAVDTWTDTHCII